MLETNIRIVRSGVELSILVRPAAIEGTHISNDLLERVCGILRHRHHLAAVPLMGSTPSLLVATRGPVPAAPIEQDDVVLDVIDRGEPAFLLSLSASHGHLLPRLIERALLAELARNTDLWTLDSPRIWYEAKPFQTQEGIAAYRRFEIGSLFIKDVGIGIAIDIGTTFFSSSSLAYFFDANVPNDERKHRRNLFTELSGRQQGQKGTLLYDIGRSRHKCYFEDAPEGVTCGTTGKFRFSGRTYDSLFHYYHDKYPELPITDETPAAKVSFIGLDRPKWVASDRLYVRVMNDDLPESLAALDKIEPTLRYNYVETFWKRLGPTSLGSVAEGFEQGYWRPGPAHVAQFVPVEIEFGQHKCLPAPRVVSREAYRDYYLQRLKFLENVGCFSVPPTVGRTIYCAYPRASGEAVARQLAGDIVQKISKWTGRPFDSALIPYDSVAQGLQQVRRSDSSGTVLFVLNDEPAAYHEVAFNLPGWRAKRITVRTLDTYHHKLTNGSYDRKKHQTTLQMGRRRWDDFITMSALDLLQLMDIVPWRTGQLGPYEAQLVIDVGHDRRHFALSLLIARNANKAPSFQIVSEVYVKSDPKHESINRVVLADSITRIFQKAMRHRFDTLASMLVIRDGQLGGQEPEGIAEALTKLVAEDKLSKNAVVEIVDFHKDTLKSVRFWEVSNDQQRTNPLEGKAIFLNSEMAVFTATGAATLHQGTAQPVLVCVGKGRSSKILEAAEAIFGGAQLNWSSPSVAQKWSIALKRTDEELSARAAQEIRNIR